MYKWIPTSIIVFFYLMVGTLYATYTPDWEAPDEPAHYNYVRQLAAGRWPVIEPGDYDQAYINEVVFQAHFDPAYSIDPFEYEDWQPPLYYLLLTPIFWVTDGSLTALRLTSLLIGAGIVILAYAITRHLWPKQTWVAYTTAVFVAFLPQHLAIMSSINNDSLAELLIAAIVWCLIQIEDWQSDNHKSLLFTTGILLGLGFLTKGTVYLMVPLIGLLLLWQYWGKWSQLWQAGLTLFTPAFLLGLLWWGRNIVVYGGLDIMGAAAHDAVVVGQARTADWIATNGLVATGQRFLFFTFNSFWGQFGWMTIVMPSWVYRPLWLLSGFVVIGLLYQKRATSFSLSIRNLTPASFILLLLPLLALVLYLGYNITFVQHQGRYLFPALIPISIGVTWGLSGWLRPFASQNTALYNLLPLTLALMLIGLDLLALFKFIVPNL